MQNLVSEFQKKYEQEPDPHLQITLIREEFLELHEAVQFGDLFDVAKELADLLYVTYGLAHMMGINAGAVVQDVHTSNMSKEGVREDGKITKGPRFRPAIPRPEWFS